MRTKRKRPGKHAQNTKSAAVGRALESYLTPIFRVANCRGQLCHVLEVYIWLAISFLGEIEVRRGLDKNFAQGKIGGTFSGSKGEGSGLRAADERI